jgi:hypothetical protein
LIRVAVLDILGALKDEMWSVFVAKVYLYFPFNDYKKDGAQGGLQDFLEDQDKSFRFEVIVRGKGLMGSRVLARVADDDLLMCCGHGDIAKPNELYLCTSEGTTVMTANDLAAQLETSGLPKTHQSILLLNCWGGGNSSLSPGTVQGAGPGGTKGQTSPGSVVVTNNGYGQCLASVVAKALGGRSYRSILVGGFPGTVTSSYTLGGMGFYSGATRVLAQIDHMQWYDCTGQNTSSPPPVGKVVPRRTLIGTHRGP